ncbi:MAG: hypothetical protein JW797_12030 [Bradymonadales bacterium]|nr:hypothetical protein [Bradymonadales bacterium]
MRRTTTRALTWMAAVLISWVISPGAQLAAQQPPDPAPPQEMQAVEGQEEPSEPDLQQQREQIRQRLRILRAWRLTEMIEMPENTAIQLFDLLDEYDLQMEALQAQLEDRGNQLRTYLEQATGSPQEIAQLVDEIMSLHLQIEQARVALVQHSAAILEPRQRAALMLFIPQFEGEVQQMFREVRRGRRGERRLGAQEGNDRPPMRPWRGEPPPPPPL